MRHRAEGGIASSQSRDKHGHSAEAGWKCVATKAVDRPPILIRKTYFGQASTPYNRGGHSLRTTKPRHFIGIAKIYLKLCYNFRTLKQLSYPVVPFGDSAIKMIEQFQCCHDQKARQRTREIAFWWFLIETLIGTFNQAAATNRKILFAAAVVSLLLPLPR